MSEKKVVDEEDIPRTERRLRAVAHFIPVFLVLVTIFTFSWCYGGARADKLFQIMPWMIAFTLEGLLFYPQRKPGEEPFHARRRVWRELAHDWMFYYMLLFLIILIIPIFNRGLCPSCDYEAILAGANPDPPLLFAPFCVNVPEHVSVIVWFVPAFVSVLAARHALQRDGRRILTELIAWNGAALAILGFIQHATGAEFPYWETGANPTDFFSTFGYPNMGGSFFVLCFALSVGVWQYRMQQENRAARHHVIAMAGKGDEKYDFVRAYYMIFPIVLNLVGALFTLSRAAILLAVVLALLAFLYEFVRNLFSRQDRARHIKHAAITLVAFALLAGLVNVFAPENMGREVDTVTTTGVLDRVSGRGQYHNRVATQVFKNFPLFGVGGWGYKHFCIPYMTPEELNDIQKVGGVNVHNDHLQFLAEHGLIGYGLLVGILLSLVLPLLAAWRRLLHRARFTSAKNAPPRPVAIYCLPSAIFWTLAGAIAVFIHAFGDCPLRSPAVLTCWLVALACATGFLPADEER